MGNRKAINIDFSKEAKTVAKELLGKFICRKFDDGSVLRFCITETEAYDDHEKVTYKNAMFLGVGEWCSYNGMLMINCKTDQRHDNVLIRAVDCVKGPCNLADRLKLKEIAAELRKKDVLCYEKLWLEDWGVTVEQAPDRPRVGIRKKAGREAEEKKNYSANALSFPCFRSADGIETE